MRNIVGVLLFFLAAVLMSCKSNEVLVYKSIAEKRPHLVTGAYLGRFFEERDDILKYKLQVSRETIKKLKTVRDSINKGYSVDNDNSYKYSYYDYAIIYKNDTLYSALLIGWMYKNKIGPYEDIFVGDEFEKNSN